MWWFGRRRKRPAAGLRREVRSVTLRELGAIDVHVTVDCLGAVCPRPQLLTMKAIDQMRDGEVLELLIDNPSSAEAIPAMGMTLGSTHLATVKDEQGWRIYVRKGYPDES